MGLSSERLQLLGQNFADAFAVGDVDTIVDIYRDNAVFISPNPRCCRRHRCAHLGDRVIWKLGHSIGVNALPYDEDTLIATDFDTEPKRSDLAG